MKLGNRKVSRTLEKYYEQALRKGFCWVDGLQKEQHIFTEVVEGEAFISIPVGTGKWFVGYLGTVRFLWYAAPRHLQRSYNAIIDIIEQSVPVVGITRTSLLEEIEDKVVSLLRKTMIVFK